jgi:hypothetical protein
MLATAGATASADSFTPVTLSITIAPVARLRQPLKVTVAVSADAGVLDTRTAPLRIQVKLAGECAGVYPYTPGTVLLDQELHPQPSTGQAYSAGATGSGTPAAYGVQTVCAFLDQGGSYDLQFATDTSDTVDVSRPCTLRAAAYDHARRALVRAERQLRGARGRATRTRLRRLVARRGAGARTAGRAARKACGPGVPL